MRKIYESPEAQIVSFEAQEQLALLTPRADGSTDINNNPDAEGSVGSRGDDY